jgi:hypothetical protein
MNKMSRTICGLCGGLFGCVSVSSAAMMSPNLPAEHTYTGIPYRSGGVGVDEREALRSMTSADNLQLIFAARDGKYLSDVDVVITNSAGHKILRAVSNGPWLLTKLPAGSYLVTAEAKGRSIHRMVNVPSSGQTHVLFSWEDSILKAPLSPVASK